MLLDRSERSPLTLGGMLMDSRTFAINNLRVLNDYLSQTVDAILQVQRLSVAPLVNGLTHTPFFGQTPFGVGVDPFTQGLGFGANTIPFAGTTPFNTNF